MSRLAWHTADSLLALRSRPATRAVRFSAHAFAQRRVVCLRQMSFLLLKLHNTELIDADYMKAYKLKVQLEGQSLEHILPPNP